MEFETEQLKYFTQSLTTSYDFVENVFLNAPLTASSNDISWAETGSNGKLPVHNTSTADVSFLTILLLHSQKHLYLLKKTQLNAR